ncbi:TRAP transporter small permease [Pseudogracilibacillus sp. SO10305]|uniref:TRAP transporter small permease n=1 Tax=Pseudogracilibacillus sp. SO10305 TaxID=3098292 RepID=UPI00300E3976
MDLMKSITRIAQFMDKTLEIFAMITIVISVALAFINVILRYFYGISYELLIEISTYSIVYGVFAYVGPLIKQDEHIKMNILREFFQDRKFINYIDIFISFLMLCIFTYLFYGGILWSSSLLEMGSKTLSGEMLLFIPALAVVAGMVIGLIYSLLQMIKEIREIIEK